MSDACKHRSGRKTPPSYSFPSLGSRERASRHALVLPGPGPTKGTEDGSCFTREGELHGAPPHRAGAPTIAIGVCKSDTGIGRTSCRERGCQDESLTGGAI